MAALIDDLDVITQIESGYLELEQATFNLSDLVMEVLDQLEQKSKRFGIQVEFVDESRRNVEVIGDAPKIEQVVTNLVSNSLRYGKEGGKTQVRFFDMEEQVLIEVADDGIGMSEEHLPRIFERLLTAWTKAAPATLVAVA